MTKQAVAKAKRLSEAEPDALGQILLDEIESERQWDKLIGKSQDKLSKLADRAWAEHELTDGSL